MTGIRESTKDKMRDVLTMLIKNNNVPMNKTQIIIKSDLPDKSYSHTMHELKSRNLITNQDPPNSRRWSATVHGMNWLKDNMFQPEYDGDAMRYSNARVENRFANAGMTEFNPNISFIEAQPPTMPFEIPTNFAPAGSVSNGDVIRLNLTDIMQFINAIIGDRSSGEMSWMRDGRNFSVQVNDGIVNLFLESGN